MRKRRFTSGLAKIILGATIALGGCEKNYDTPAKPTDTSAPIETSKPIDYSNKALMLILDTSGSMDDMLSNRRKIDIEREAVLGVLEECKTYAEGHPDFQMGVITFVGRRPEILIPIGRFDYETLRQKVQNLHSTGGTPLGLAIGLAEEKLDATGIASKHMILATDGENQDGPEPFPEREKVYATNLRTGDTQTEVSFIGINMNPSYFDQFRNRGDRVYSAGEARQVIEAFRQNAGRILCEKEDDPTIDYNTNN